MIRANIIIIFFFLAALQPVRGQVENIRKIQQSLSSISDSLRYVDAINTVSLLLYEQNVDSSLYYANIARAISRRLGYAKGIADATNNIGIVFDIKGNTQFALRYYNDAFNEYSSIHDSSNMVQTIMNIAMVYNLSGNNAKAIANFKHALAIGEGISHDSIMSLAIYNFMLDYPGEFTASSANAYIQKALAIALKYHDVRILVAIKQLKANELIKIGNKDEGIKLLRETVDTALHMNLYFLSLDPLIELGDLLINNDTAKALAYYKHALAITEQNEFHSYSKMVIKKLYDFYVAKNNITLAYYYSRKLLTAYENEQNNNDTAGIDYIEYALKDQQLEAAQIKSAYSSRLLWLVGAICALAITIIIIQLGNRRRSQKTHTVLQHNFAQLESATNSLEQGNKNYARLIRIVAHDLRNPIGAINSICTLLLSDNKLGPAEQDWIKLIHKSSQSCLQLISELLQTDFMLKEDSLNKENIDLSALLQQTVKLLNFRAIEKKQPIILQETTSGEIFGDYNKLSRVMNNLIVNAIKFSKEGGTIWVNAEKKPEGILLTVKDTGIGIPATIANQLFNPFSNAKRQGTAGEPSFGLGLYISKQIIDAHRGRIWFESEPGKGTTFYILLPEKTE